MLLDREIGFIMDGHGWMVAQMAGWREDGWDKAQADPQVGEDLSALYYLQGQVEQQQRMKAGRLTLDGWGQE